MNFIKIFIIVLALSPSCCVDEAKDTPQDHASTPDIESPPYYAERETMIKEQIMACGMTEKNILDAPFDAIIVTCAPTHVPALLKEQLREGGRMIIPVGEFYVQKLVYIKKVNDELKHQS